jgi:thioredoxin reductase
MIGSSQPDVAIIGAGPYALSVAAHLRAAGVGFRMFGKPMQTWLAHMPKGMYLKSEGCASNLFDPTGSYSLQQFCAEEKVLYGQSTVPVSLETFTRYALSFQKRFVPAVEDVMVAALDGGPSRFELRLASGEALEVRKVVVATGVSHAAHVPAELAPLPTELLSHSSNHHDLARFKGQHVTVIGGGQSALETAALLHEAGAEALLIARRPSLAWNDHPAPGRRSLYQRLRRPMSELGPGLGPWFYSNAPLLFRCLPRRTRFARVKTALGPAGAWWLKERVLGRLPIQLGCSLVAAEARGDGALLRLRGPGGEGREIATEHVIAATGYRFTLRSLPFLGERLRKQVRSVQDTPVLSANFESSVAGLYFTGLASANTFGPAMRFLHGAGVTAQRVSRHISGGRRLGWLFNGRGSASRCKEVGRKE